MKQIYPQAVFTAKGKKQAQSIIVRETGDKAYLIFIDCLTQKSTNQKIPKVRKKREVINSIKVFAAYTK